MRLEDFIETSNKAHSIDELSQLLMKALGEMGLDRAICAQINPYNKQQDIDTKFLIRYPEDWMKHYLENDYINSDPVCRWLVDKQFVFTWEDIRKRWISQREKLILDEANEAGFYNGGAVSVILQDGTILGLGFARSQKDKELHKTELHKISALAHQYYIALNELEQLPRFVKPKIKLTGKEKDIINWCAQGKSNSCIADILTISEHAVNFHLRNIYRKLDTNNKTLAVLKAYRANLMDTYPSK
jgi:DNA-binding CsgD family transcriptional regulator